MRKTRILWTAPHTVQLRSLVSFQTNHVQAVSCRSVRCVERRKCGGLKSDSQEILHPRAVNVTVSFLPATKSPYLASTNELDAGLARLTFRYHIEGMQVECPRLNRSHPARRNYERSSFDTGLACPASTGELTEEGVLGMVRALSH